MRRDDTHFYNNQPILSVISAGYEEIAIVKSHEEIKAIWKDFDIFSKDFLHK